MSGNLTKCSDCGKEISKNAKSCPNCGAVPKRTHPFTMLMALLGAFWLIGYALSGFNDNAITPPPSQGVTSSQPLTSNAGPVTRNPSQAAKISSWAVDDITQKQYPSLYKAWGPTWVKKLNKMQHQVAKKASLSPECDTVDMVALSDQRSVVKKSAVFFADCANGKRFYISDTDLKNVEPVKSKQSQTSSLSDTQAVTKCEAGIRSKMNFPSSFKSSFFSKSVYRAPTGNIAVTMDFEGMNGFGAKLPMTARCIFDDRGMSGPEISNR